MFEVILLLGLVALFAAWRGTAKRLEALEARVADMGEARVGDVGEARAAVPVWQDELPVVQVVAPVEHARPVAVVPEAFESEPQAEPAPILNSVTPSLPESLSGLFERFVGGRLLVWTGGIAIALAGLFLVRYSIELGLIGPRVRMIAAAVFGAALVAAGELARRRVRDDLRVGQALVGAGVLVLYAAAYGSHILYGLITLTTAFVLMAAIAAGALFLSLRHGTPTAALGLVGGFATPLLVGRSTGEAAPLLMYLALLNIAVLAVAVRSARPWLGWAAKLMTLGWTATLLDAARDDALLTGSFLLIHTVATGLGWRDHRGREEPVPSLGPTLALLQIGAVVTLAHFSPAAWSLLFAFGVAGFALAERSSVLAAVPGRALTAALALLAVQIGNESYAYATAVTLLFAGGAWWRLDRGVGRLSSTLIFCASVAGPAMIRRMNLISTDVSTWWGLLFAMLALAPAALAWRMRAFGRPDAPFDKPLLLAAATAAGLLVVAVPDLVSSSWIPAGWMLVALALVAGGRRIGDGGVLRLAMLVGALALASAAEQSRPLWQSLIEAIVGVPVLSSALPSPASALQLFAVPGAVGFLAWRGLPGHERGLVRVAATVAAVLACLASYIVFKQLFALRTTADFVARGFAERTLLTQGLFFAGWLLLKRPRLTWLAMPALALTVVAAARFVLFDVLVLNPALVPQNVGAWPGLILVAYGASTFWLWEMRRRAAAGVPSSIGLALFLAAAIVGSGLLVRQIFHGAILVGAEMPRPEFYGYSLAGLVLSVALLMLGTRRGDKPLRVAGLALLTATVVKVFVWDAAALEGLLRIISFAGLGAALIGMGKLYGTVLGRAKPA